MGKMTTDETPRARVHRFLAAFRAAPNDADIEIRIGSTDYGMPAVIVTLEGSNHAFTTVEARTLADIMEEAMHAHPDDPESATVPNIIMALRYGCNEADAAHPVAQSSR